MGSWMRIAKKVDFLTMYLTKSLFLSSHADPETILELLNMALEDVKRFDLFSKNEVRKTMSKMVTWQCPFLY